MGKAVRQDSPLNAAGLFRKGDFEKAAVLLEKEPGRADPYVSNDLAVALHQAGRTREAVEILRGLDQGEDLPAIVRFNRFYMEKVLEIQNSFDPSWQHKDHDGIACPQKPPLVSVIVRTYNRPDLLKQALESLKAQTLEDFETIVVNDGGDQEAEEVTASSGLANARYFMTKHEGCWAAMNRGLEMAHGEYVTGLDDDDVFLPPHLETLVSHLERPGSAPACYPRTLVRTTVQGQKAPRERFRGEPFSRPRLYKTNMVSSVMLMCKRQCYEDAGKFCEDLPIAGDWEMWLRLSHKYGFDFVDKVTAVLNEREPGANITSRKAMEKHFWDNTILMMHRGIILAREPKDPALSEGYQKALCALDGLLGKREDLLTKVSLRGLWDMKKPYRWFADQARWFMAVGEHELAKDFYRSAVSFSPLQPKLWAGYIKAAAKGAA